MQPDPEAQARKETAQLDVSLEELVLKPSCLMVAAASKCSDSNHSRAARRQTLAGACQLLQLVGSVAL